jgi:hypothetical protein
MVGSPPFSSQVTAVCVRGTMLVPVRLRLSGRRSGAGGIGGVAVAPGDVAAGHAALHARRPVAGAV